MKKMLKSAIVVATLLFNLTPALAQDTSTNRVFAETDWGGFVEDNPKQCWIVSEAKDSVNTRDGNVIAVTRSETLMFVSFWPGAGKLGEVSFTGGYPYGEGATVQLDIGSNRFQLFTSGENAWAASADEDNKIIAAMKRGASAVVTGVSARGTKTVDTISLLGFTKALEDATKRCS